MAAREGKRGGRKIEYDPTKVTQVGPDAGGNVTLNANSINGFTVTIHWGPDDVQVDTIPQGAGNWVKFNPETGVAQINQA